MIGLILNFLPIFAISLVFAAVFFVVFCLTEDKGIASIFKKSMEYVFLFIVSGVVIFPFSHLHLSSLGSSEKGLLSGLFLLVVYLVILVLLRARLKSILVNIVLLFQQKYFGIYLGLIVCSSFWSSTPLLTFRSAFSFLLISSFAVHFAREYNWQQNFNLLRYSQAIIAVFSIFMAFFVPSEGLTEKGWAGGIGHPIDLGNMMALAASFWLLNTIQNRKYLLISLPICMLCIAIMQLANSAGAFVIFISLVVIVFVLPLFRKLNFLQANFLFTVILIFFSIPSIWVISNFNQITSLLDKDLTFTGRVPLWNFLVEEYIQKRLWLGYGYSGFWQSWQGSENPAASVYRLIGDWAVHAHNGFIDIILSVGLIGFTVFALSFIVNVGRAIKLVLTNRSPQSILPLMVLTYVFLSNLSHSPIIMPGYTWFLYVIVTTKLQMEYSNNKMKRYRSLSPKNLASS